MLHNMWLFLELLRNDDCAFDWTSFAVDRDKHTIVIHEPDTDITILFKEDGKIICSETYFDHSGSYSYENYNDFLKDNDGFTCG